MGQQATLNGKRVTTGGRNEQHQNVCLAPDHIAAALRRLVPSIRHVGQQPTVDYEPLHSVIALVSQRWAIDLVCKHSSGVHGWHHRDAE
jgi:hypothetical protein